MQKMIWATMGLGEGQFLTFTNKDQVTYQMICNDEWSKLEVKLCPKNCLDHFGASGMPIFDLFQIGSCSISIDS